MSRPLRVAAADDEPGLREDPGTLLPLRGHEVIAVADRGPETAGTRAPRAGLTRRPAVARLEGPHGDPGGVPTAAPSTFEEFRREADDCDCDITPEPFHAVGLWYEDFSQTTDDEVRDLLERSAAPVSAATGPVKEPVR